VFYIKYCKILNKVIQEAEKIIIIDLKLNLITSKDNMEHNKTGNWENTGNWADVLSSNKWQKEKIKDPDEAADVFNSFFLSIGENLDLHQVGK
jgi:hypothetical protein